MFEDDDRLKEILLAIIPKTLDDIIRINRHLASLRLTTHEEIMALHQPIMPRRAKEILSDWRFISLEIFEINRVDIMLLGTKSDGTTRITSIVRIIDLDRGYVFTNSESLYQLGPRGKGEPPFEHLAMICSAFHSWGFGEHLGVPMFWY